MINLNLTTKNAEQELVKKHLEENASETLAEKINNGVAIEKDGKTLISRKTLDGFMRYAADEARKLAEKGASSACVRSDVVFGWAIHYFEEDSIEGKLYNEDGSEYKPPKREVKKTTKTASAVSAAPKKDDSSQLSLFDFSGNVPTSKAADTPKVSPLYTRYMALADKYPTALIALRVGDFYEVFGEKAELVADKLELTLASRDLGLEERVPMVGFPYHRVDVYRDKIREFTSVAIVENEDNIQFFLKKDSVDLQVNTETGEVTEKTKDERIDDFIGILFGILKDDLEVKL